MNPWNAADMYFDPDTFSGVARLFPLPNLVLYPHVMQPLHIFEERYREMLEDALAGDRLIAMAMLEPGWEPDYEGRPPIAPFACLGKIVTHHRLPDGRYNLLLMGVHRIRILGEIKPPRSFRRARVKLLREVFANPCRAHREELQRDMLAAFERYLPCGWQAAEQLGELFAQHLPLGMMTDLAAYALPLEMDVKQQLLAECRVDVRAELLLGQLSAMGVGEAVGAVAESFPPPFSVN